MSTHRFVLPRSDGSWLTDPVPADWPALVSSNATLLSHLSFDCQGRSLADLRSQTQRHVRQLALRYTSELLDSDVTVPETSRWIVTGHQPELFHAGVWVKNFAVDRLAQSTESIGLNLLVDNDTHAGTGINVPVGTRAAPRLETVLYDGPRPICPWEELPLADRAAFESFPRRVKERLEPWGVTPVLSEFWPAALRYAARTPEPRLSDCLAALRVAAERRWGVRNLELPMSRLDVVPGFLWFAANLLAHLPRFQELHNRIVLAYRQRHRLRSRTHPVPDLATDGDWREAPFWVWRAGDPQRDRLFVKQSGAEILLRDRRDVFLCLPLTPERSACCAVEQLATLPARGIRLRSRALTTTLFARLFLADLFVHGIGGAKYDEMTDALIAGFYQASPPPYAVISATLHLPLGGREEDTRLRLGENSQALWALEHNPEKFLAQLSVTEQQLVQEKLRLIQELRTASGPDAQAPTGAARDANRRRYQRLHEITGHLQPSVSPAREQLAARRAEMLSELRAQRILTSREFAWALFPSEKLRGFLQQLPVG